MNKKYLRIGALVLVCVVGLYCMTSNLLTSQNHDIINSATSTFATSTEVAVNEYEPEEIDNDELNLKYAEISKLLEADKALSAKRTLEITGWKKLGDQNRLEFTGKGIEIWFPEEWFSYNSYDSGRGSVLNLYRWPDGMERTEEDKELLRQYFTHLDQSFTDLEVISISFSNLGSRILPLNTDFLKESTSYIYYEDDISEITVSGFKAKKLSQVFLKPDNTLIVQYALILEDLPKGFPYVDIIITNNKYTNAEEIFNEIVERIVIIKE